MTNKLYLCANNERITAMTTYSLNLNGRLLDLSSPHVMAILNVTPDSFFEQSRVKVSDLSLLNAAEKALHNGASILDIGAYSSRPGAEDVPQDEELRRLDAALSQLRKAFPTTPLSVDTFRGAVTKMVVEHYEVDLINDISGGTLDPTMLPTVAQLNRPYILMHMKGNPQTMQNRTTYDNFLSDLLKYFAEKIELLRTLGHTADIILDPGFGFAKTSTQNFELLNHLDLLETFKRPILAGLSRKTMIWQTLGVKPSQALNGTTALHMVCLEKGARILRVHDVKEAMETIQLFKAMQGAR